VGWRGGRCSGWAGAGGGSAGHECFDARRGHRAGGRCGIELEGGRRIEAGLRGGLARDWSVQLRGDIGCAAEILTIVVNAGVSSSAATAKCGTAAARSSGSNERIDGCSAMM